MAKTVLVIEDGVLTEYKGHDSHVVIPNDVTAIDDWAFFNCEIDDELEVEFGTNVTSIGEGAFGCDPDDDFYYTCTIKFNGTKADWGKIECIDEGGSFASHTTVECLDGTIEIEGYIIP